MTPREPTADERDPVARLWHAGWHDAHASLLPAELTRTRSLESFQPRLDASWHGTRVVGPPGAPVGLCIVRGDELYQLFVAPAERGTGVAAALLADAEHRMSQSGVRTAWLSCAIGNTRAARFYDKSGWSLVGSMRYHTETPAGPFPVDVWRYEKALVSRVE